MSDMSVDTVFQGAGDAKRDRQWVSEHPVWARIGDFMERLASFCGTHSAGYVAPVRTDRDPR
ncbi:hypothetical protein V5738_06125 [Salinisphaera sp. SPP-AMP-43]|uniref:hypothetical protein n=1 Tax=Salinisphaera sp. SPP-AMP-43 TaxID=3121288 RepID=UPI003C6E4207